MKKYTNIISSPNMKLAAVRDLKKNPEYEYNSVVIPEDFKSYGANKKYFIRTYGCQGNLRDSEVIAGILRELGYTQTDSVDNADIIILNTCCVRENAEKKVFGEIGTLKSLKQKNPGLLIGVCGCMVQQEHIVDTLLSKYQQVDLIFGTHNIHQLPSLIKDAVLANERVCSVLSNQGDIQEDLPSCRESTYKAWVNIMYGCNKFCTYCIVPYTRGKERSRKSIDILNEIKQLKEMGYKEVTLLGQNVNAYGKDINDLSFAQLMEQVALIGIDRIRFTTSHPWDFSDELIDVIAKYPNIMIEGCSGGGGRFDPAMLYYTPQIWTSDDTDAIERLFIQYGTSIVYPPTSMVGHVSVTPNHQTGRITPFKTRGIVAMSANFGYELNPQILSESEREMVKKQTKEYASLRKVIYDSDFYRLRSPFNGNDCAWSFVRKNKKEVYVMYVRILNAATNEFDYLLLKGLDANKIYENVETKEDLWEVN